MVSLDGATETEVPFARLLCYKRWFDEETGLVGARGPFRRSYRFTCEAFGDLLQFIALVQLSRGPFSSPGGAG